MVLASLKLYYYYSHLRAFQRSLRLLRAVVIDNSNRMCIFRYSRQGRKTENHGPMPMRCLKEKLWSQQPSMEYLANALTWWWRAYQLGRLDHHRIHVGL